MESFADKIAVVTGGGTGMGRELVLQLADAGCHVAMCDVSEDNMADTKSLAVDGVRVTTHVADVADEAAVLAFRDAVTSEHQTDHVNLVFNNAGIGGGGSFVTGDRAEWEAVFNVCWGGVYNGSRAFVPMLVASTEGHLVNTSSVNGFWASLGPARPHTAYSAAKFAVKGFTEALVTDFRVNAPHVSASVVMPGHIGTSIVANSGSYFGRNPKDMDDEALAQVRAEFGKQGLDVSGASDEDIRAGMIAMADGFRDNAPMTAAEAATVILDGVKAKRWRILVGQDAHALDQFVRHQPEEAYEPALLESLGRDGHMGFAN
jgi:NAD(P)-dependent dehydrogenase (short-subunit alcohol dehydrogenase family)